MIRQAKDIPDETFLDAVRRYNNGEHTAPEWDGGPPRPRWAFVHEIAADLDAPEKVVRAKARKLIARRLMNGCACGCRGDFEVPGTRRLDRLPILQSPLDDAIRSVESRAR